MALSDDTYVHDSRNGNIIGPFSPSDATTMASQLNIFVLQHEMPVFAGMCVTVTGPFYVHGHRRRIY